MRQWETMIKLSSRLRADEGKLKRLPIGEKTWRKCELGAMENLRHFLMECPYVNDEKCLMVKGLYAIIPNFERQYVLRIIM